MITITWSLFWLPFVIACLITFFFSAKPVVAKGLTTVGLLITFLMSVMLLFQYQTEMHGVKSLESSLIWMKIGSVPIEFGVLLNGLTILMLLVVTGIGTLVSLFSISYMSHEEGQSRYFASLSLFAFSMLGIVLANNLIQIFIFWELVGLSSYLLIGFWFEKDSAAMASKKAFITTRVGDVGMMIGILLLFGQLVNQGVGTFNFLELQKLFPHLPEHMQMVNIDPNIMTAIVILIFLGVVGKSAQVPLHVWLPDAMEGPTPVSALIHAATMVAAGIYLLVRLSFLFEASATGLAVIAWTGALTALIAGTVAIAQNDVKKVLAYSTLSQLGYMVLALGLASPVAGMFHLTTHAFFKALLFLGAGSLIHAMHTQDIWKMSGRNLLSKMPITSWTFIIATAALMGLPPLSGFYSKEEILAVAQHGSLPLFVIAMAVVFLTSFYMGRVCTVVFFSKNKAKDDHPPHEGNWQICLPLLVLVVLSIIGGFLPIKDLISGGHGEGHHGHGFNLLAIASLGLAAAGFVIAFIKYRSQTSETFEKFPKNVLASKYHFDDFYDGLIKYTQESLATASDFIERKLVVDGAANGTAKGTRTLGDFLRKLQTGVVQGYALFFTLGMSVLIYFFVLRG